MFRKPCIPANIQYCNHHPGPEGRSQGYPDRRAEFIRQDDFSKRLAIQLLSEGISPLRWRWIIILLIGKRLQRMKMGTLILRFGCPQSRLAERTYQTPHAGERFNCAAIISKRASMNREKKFSLHRADDHPGGHSWIEPKLLESMPTEQAFRIYVSCLTQLNLDRHNGFHNRHPGIAADPAGCYRSGYSRAANDCQLGNVRVERNAIFFPYQETRT